MQSESDDERKRLVQEVSTKLDFAPKAFRLWLVPFFLSFAIGVCGLLIKVGCGDPGELWKINLNLLLAGISSFYIAGAYYDFRTNKLAKQLFWQKKDKNAPRLSFAETEEAFSQSLRKWTELDWDWSHEGEGANVPEGLGRFIVTCVAYLCYFMAFVAFVAMPKTHDPTVVMWHDVARALLLIAATYFKVTSQLRVLHDLKNTYLKVSENENLNHLLKPVLLENRSK